MINSDDLRQRVLQAISDRESGAGFEAIAIDGWAPQDVSAMVQTLHREGFLEAAFVEHGFGPGADAWQPSFLTEKGRRTLAKAD